MTDTTAPQALEPSDACYTDEYRAGMLDERECQEALYVRFVKAQTDALTARIAELEQQLAERGEWEPLPYGIHKVRTQEGRTTIEVRADMLILETRQSIVTAVLPDDVRMCRQRPTP